MTYWLKRDSETIATQKFTFARSIEQWMYAKSAPYPGSWYAPFMLPGLRGYWASTIVGGTGSNWINRAATTSGSTHLNAIYTGVSADVDISTAWPGAVAPYVIPAATIDGAYYELFNYAGMGDTVIGRITGAQTLGLWAKVRDTSYHQELLWNNAFEQDVTSSCVEYSDTASAFQYRTSEDNTHYITAIGTRPSATTWYFLAGRFTPGSSVCLYQDGTVYTTATSATALYDEGATSFFAAFPFDAAGSAPYIAQAWLCAYAIPDAWLKWLYKMQAPLFGQGI